MALGCGVKFMRGVLLVLNVLFVIVGIALIGLGVYIKVDDNFASILSKIADISDFEGQSLGFLAFVMIGGGVFTLLIALFGCMGALWKNRCFLYLYALILGLLMILELTAFIMAFVYKSKLTDVYENTLFTVFENALAKNQTNVIGAFHELENKIECCGVHGFSDYKNHTNATSGWCASHPDSQGCSKAIIGYLNTHLPIIGGTLGGVILLELFGILGAIALAVAIGRTSDSDDRILFKNQNKYR